MLRTRRYTIAAVAAFCALTAGAARAGDDGQPLAKRICTAIANVKSFRATMAGFAGMTGEMTFVRPDRMKYAGAFGPVTSEVVVVGATSYTRINDGAWTTTTTNGAAAAAKQLADSFSTSTLYKPLPDRHENGETVGAFMSSLPLPAAAAASSSGSSASTAKSAPALSETCTYDKLTYYVRSCTMQIPNLPAPLTMRYSHWDDAGNVVDVPAGAPAAPVTPVTSAAPAASAAPETASCAGVPNPSATSATADVAK